MQTLTFVPHVPLAPLTTLQLGGVADYWVEATAPEHVLHAAQWAHERGVPLIWLGGGSNVVISDEGLRGLVICMRESRITHFEKQGFLWLTAMAGTPWDHVVAYAIAHEATGLECLSGIPGLTGATPVQNVGAYGQEIADTLFSARVYDTQTQEIEVWSAAQCAFSYRSSRFKLFPSRWVVLEVTFRLPLHEQPTLRYEELRQTLQSANLPLSLQNVRQVVLSLRRKKSMIFDPQDENHRSVGSFFLNPIVPQEQALQLQEQLVHKKVIAQPNEMPSYPADPGHRKLSAAWLIERSGWRKGYRQGAVGISSRHTLCLVHHGGGTTQALVELAQQIQKRVCEEMGVHLRPEPVFLGFSTPPLL